MKKDIFSILAIVFGLLVLLTGIISILITRYFMSPNLTLFLTLTIFLIGFISMIISLFIGENRKLKIIGLIINLILLTILVPVFYPFVLDVLSKNNTNPILCNFMSHNWNRKSNCYLNVAYNLEDASYCEKMDDKLTKTSFTNLCYKRLAIKLNDESLCIDEDCYFSLATIKKDVNLCGNINERFRDRCIYAVENNYHYCGSEVCEGDKYTCPNLLELNYDPDTNTYTQWMNCMPSPGRIGKCDVDLENPRIKWIEDNCGINYKISVAEW